jgi:glycosyltransferase involved in cell wall biosynthesis
MNRLVCTNLDVTTPASQAALPTDRGRAPHADEPARILFINGQELGFGTTGRMLQGYTQTRSDIEAVHYSVVMPAWLRLACAESPIRAVKFSGIDLHQMRMMWAWRSLLRRQLRHLHPERFDVVHFMTQQRALVVPRLRARLPARIRLVVNSDATALGWDRAFEYRRFGPTPNVAAERRIFRAADAVACASQWVADSVIRDYGVPAERVFLHKPCARLPDGVSPRVPDAHIRRAAAGDARLRLVFVGNAWVRKGGPRLVAWHQSRWADRAELHIISSEAPADRAARNIQWHGRVEHDRLIRELLPSMDLFIMPTMEDTFLIAAQEAQALGLPVVTSDLAGIPEVVLHERTGLLCLRRDDAAFITAVERFLNDPELLTCFSAAAAKHAAHDLSADRWHGGLLDRLVAMARASS